MKHQGLHTNRLTKAADNPREVAFAKEWQKENIPGGMTETDYTLDRLLWDTSEPSERDAVVAATVIQWLGSNVGMSFLRNALARVGMVIVEKKH